MVQSVPTPTSVKAVQIEPERLEEGFMNRTRCKGASVESGSSVYRPVQCSIVDTCQDEGTYQMTAAVYQVSR